MRTYYTFTISIFLLFLVSTIYAGEQTLLEINFEQPIWRELLSHSWGSKAAEIENGALVLQDKAAWRTRYFSYRSRTEIYISIEAKSLDIERGKKKRDVGRVTLVGYNDIKKSVCHFDIVMLRGTSKWKKYKIKKEFPESVKFFTLSLSNAAKTGSIYFNALRVAVLDNKAEHLMGDPNFKGSLGMDHWFQRKRGKDWDKLQTGARKVSIDRKKAVIGKRCVKFTGASALLSKKFPYHGEKLIFSAWMRTKNIKVGRRGWCKAGIQLVGFGAKGKILMHTDLIIRGGTTKWTFYKRQIQFQDAIKKVQIWVRMFPGATGTAWFDGVSLKLIPFKGTRTPFNAKRASIQINASKPGRLINDRVWGGIDHSYITRIMHKGTQESLPLLKKVGINMFRFREISSYRLETYNRDDPKTGKAIYKWNKIDKLLDILVNKYGFILNITIESTPPALARKGTPRRRFCNRWAPSNYKKWGLFIEAFMDHVIKRYGKNKVEKWYWEIWNEPMAQKFYKGTPEEFVQIAEQFYLASERVEKRYNIDLKIGLTSGGSWINNYVLEHLKKIKKLHLIEHYTEHFYYGGRTPLRLISERIDNMKQLLKKYPGIRSDCELGSTEWNSNSMGGKRTWNPWNASCAIKTIRLMLDSGLDYTTFFAFHEYPYRGDKSPTFSNLGMIALNGVPKPVYNAFVFLHELRGGKRLKLVSSNDPIDGLAVLMPDGRIRIVLTNYDENTLRQPYNTKVTMKISGVKGKNYSCTRHLATDNKHGNSYGKWLELGKPMPSDQKAKAAMSKASHPVKLAPVVVKESNGTLHLTMTVPSPGIRFIELTPKSNK